MIVISGKRAALMLTAAIFAAAVSSFFYMETKNVFSGNHAYSVIIDAGHGFPDGGAVGGAGSIECEINLKVSKLLKKGLEKEGIAVVMTRTGQNAIKPDDTSQGGKKTDMYQRLDIMKKSGADMFISIHMNKFTDARYSGAQVLFAGTDGSEELAKCIQQEFSMLDENKSKRDIARAPRTLFLMRNACMPAVIVECGFLSNYEEEKLLNTPEYQKKLAEAICHGIKAYYKNLK